MFEVIFKHDTDPSAASRDGMNMLCHMLEHNLRA